MRHSASQGRSARLSLAAEIFCTLALTGCAGATRLPTRTNGPEGTTVQSDTVDLAFLQTGITRREEVLNKLNGIDTHYSNPRLFWGRWSQSRWGTWAVAPGGAAGGRIWHVHNLLLTFDEQGIMQTQAVIDDEKTLERELRAEIAKAPPLDLSQSVSFALTREFNPYSPPRSMTLTKDRIYLKCDGCKLLVVEISPLQVARISYERYYQDKSRSGTICHSLHTTEKTRLGHKVFFCTSAADAATMFQYLQEAGPPNLRWE